MSEWAILNGEFGRGATKDTEAWRPRWWADVEANLQGHHFQSRVTLVSEQFLVLGHMGFNAGDLDAFPGASREDSLTLYCVMMADFVP